MSYQGGLGAAPPSTDVWTTPIDTLLASPELQAKIPAARLYAVAVNELAKPDAQEQMSLFGNLSSDVLTSSTRLAAEQAVGQGMTPAALLNAGKEALMAVYNALPATTGGVMDSLSAIVGKTTAEVGASVASAIPIIGAFIGFVTSIEELYAAKAIADAQLAAVVCQQSYRPPVATRAGVYGGMTPADLMHSSMGDVFAAMEANTPEQAATICRTNPTAKKMLEATGLKCGMYIPAVTRRLLRILRLAIQNSWNDPNSDAGISLWPAYVDLVHAQFRQNRINRHWIAYIVDKEVLPARRDVYNVAVNRPNTTVPEHQQSRMHLHKSQVTGIDLRAGGGAEAFATPLKPGRYASQFSGGKWRVSEGKCLAVERRALDEFLGQIKEWELVINPTYQMDQAKADALRSTIEQIIRSVSGTAPPRRIMRKHLPAGQRVTLARRLAGRSSALQAGAGTSPFIALAAGGVAAGLGVWLLMRRKRAA